MVVVMVVLACVLVLMTVMGMLMIAVMFCVAWQLLCFKGLRSLDQVSRNGGGGRGG